MAEPAERIWSGARCIPVYNELSDAGKTGICRPCLYHRSGLLSGDRPHWGRQRFHTCDWKSARIGWLLRRPAQNRNQWWHFCHDRIRPRNGTQCCGQSNRRCKKRKYPPLLPCRWMWWRTSGKKLLHGICKTDTKGYDHPHARLWKISFQWSGPWRNRRTSKNYGYGSV